MRVLGEVRGRVALGPAAEAGVVVAPSDLHQPGGAVGVRPVAAAEAVGVRHRARAGELLAPGIAPVGGDHRPRAVGQRRRGAEAVVEVVVAYASLHSEMQDSTAGQR